MPVPVISLSTRLNVFALTTGGRLSRTVTVAVQLAVLREPSVAVRVTLTGVPMSAQVNEVLLNE